MPNVPDGAQLSDDGQWWWDGSNWQPVSGDGGGNTGTAAFDFDANGLRIDSESSPVPTANEALKAAFSVCNTGTAAGSAHVTFTIDGNDSGQSWDSPVLQPGTCASPDGDGYVHGLPAQSEGDHVFEGSATPAGSYAGGKATNTVKVAPAP